MRNLTLAVVEVEIELAEFGAEGRTGDISSSTSSSSSSKISDCVETVGYGQRLMRMGTGIPVQSLSVGISRYSDSPQSAV